MAVRPSTTWRAQVAEQAKEVALGRLAPANALLASFYPEDVLRDTESALVAFEAELTPPPGTTLDDRRIVAALAQVTTALAAIDARHDVGAYEAEERGELTRYLAETLTECGVDLPAFTAHHGLDPHDLTRPLPSPPPAP